MDDASDYASDDDLTVMGSVDAAPYVNVEADSVFEHLLPGKNDDEEPDTKSLIERKKAIIAKFPLKRYDYDDDEKQEAAAKDKTSDAKQGKVAELRQELTMGGKRDKNHSAKKLALKKIVANMTMSNNDMVALFPDIVQCMHIPSLEIKKM